MLPFGTGFMPIFSTPLAFQLCLLPIAIQISFVIGNDATAINDATAMPVQIVSIREMQETA